MSATSPALELLLRRRAPRTLPWIGPGPTTRAVVAGVWRSAPARIGLLLLGLLTLLAVVVPLLSPYDPVLLQPAQRLQPPSSAHWLGTDDLGRDVLTRLAVGARTSLVVGLVVSLGSVATGTLVGLLASSSRLADAVLMRTVDGLLAFPGILLGLAVAVRLGGTLPGVLLALTLVHAPLVARLVRTTTLAARQQPHVEAARAIGAGPVRIARRHVLPSAASPLLAQWSFLAGLAILAEASLAFLGVGAGPETVTWGGILRDGQRLLSTAWWIAVPAGIALTTSVLACTFVGDGLRDAIDPRHPERRQPRRPR